MSVRVTEWHLSLPRWHGPEMRVVMVADLHACWPWMSVARVRRIVEQAQGLGGDLIALMGDYPGHVFPATRVSADAVADALGALHAPLGVYAVFGNHDWRDDPVAQAENQAETFWHRLLAAQGLKVLENAAVEITNKNQEFILAGLGSQRSHYRKKVPVVGRNFGHGIDDLGTTLKGTSRDQFTLLLAHEPDVFATLPDGVDLTLSGHTHGGQIRLRNRAYVVPSAFGERYAYGHVHEYGRDLVVSGGLGCSGIPVRIAMPPELTVVTIRSGDV